MRLATQFLKQRLILLYADIFRAMRVMAVGALIAGSAGSGRSMAQGLETETIKGTVVNSITHEPIGRALVFSLDNRFAMLCDATDGTDRLTVELYKRTVQDGRARWEQAGSTQTRANGTFRFADLAGEVTKYSRKKRSIKIR
jgi:hypothetical protein